MKYFLFIIIFFSNICYSKCSNDYINNLSKIIDIIQDESSNNITKKIPKSIVIAQNILESNCGKSKAAKEKNNYYGLVGKSGKYLKFLSLKESTKYYFSNLSTHNAYKNFRTKLNENKSVDELVKILSKSYAQDPKYHKKVLGVIDTYNLDY